ncbi:MAG TPA: lytic transglycosylase domain-containing protein [Acetobacteraceae bacterium]|nr:lytic transglycosylase domain-containing protein [Acetobacteraceae bacterium]
MPRLLLAGLLFLLTTPAFSQTRPSAPQPWTQCRSAVLAAERAGAIPEHLLAAISRVESGRVDPRTGGVTPWPWTINAEGQGLFYQTKAQAIAAVRDLQARGVRSIDVGCMQINLMHHPDAFSSLDQAFDPAANAAYGARFLNQLHGQTGDWSKAAGLYHSATAELGSEYQKRVLAAWPEEKRKPAVSVTTQLASAWASTLKDAPTNRVMVVLPVSRADNVRIIPLRPGRGG